MSTLNQVNIIGALGKDPELKNLDGGKVVCTFSVATSERHNEKTMTEWHKVVVWGKLAELCAQYLSKGKKAFVQGRLQTRSWEKDGKKQYVTEIVAAKVLFLSPADVGPSEDQIFDPENLPF